MPKADPEALAAALRANLKRRKAHARATRAASEPDSPAPSPRQAREIQGPG